MVLGNEQRAWTYAEYVEKYEQLQAKLDNKDALLLAYIEKSRKTEVEYLRVKAENANHIRTINTLIENIDDGTNIVIKQLQAENKKLRTS